MQKHYIIGDIHAEYKTLLALVDRLPTDARLVFVGDLLSRGSQGKEVIAFVRENAFCCVRGNHEEYFLKFGSLFLEGVKNQKENSSPIWACKSISSTLRSYGLLEKESTRITLNQEGIEQMKKDMEWVEQLPAYFELGEVKGYFLPVVVTHAPVDKYWLFKDSHPDYFAFHAMNNRYPPTSFAPIFNIFGHIPKNEVEFGVNFVAIDTGCGRGKDRTLSAYCVETKEVVSVKWVE